MRRASLDYTDLTNIIVYDSTEELFEAVSIDRTYGATIPGNVLYTTPKYQLGDTIILGSESVGLSSHVMGNLNAENLVTIPMVPGNRSLNISNAAAIIVYEMWRQIGFADASSQPNQNKLYFS